MAKRGIGLTAASCTVLLFSPKALPQDPNQQPKHYVYYKNWDSRSFRIAAFAQQSSAPAQTVGSETRNWTGTLVDATRTDCGAEVERAVKPGTCPVSMRTANFSLILPDGKFVKFDEGGNAKAVDALRKSSKGSKIVFNYWRTGKTASAVKARVTGTLTSDTLNVDSIRID